MELKEFITKTLININEGIIDAQEQTKHSGFIINPKNITIKGDAKLLDDFRNSFDETSWFFLIISIVFISLLSNTNIEFTAHKCNQYGSN